MCGLLEPDYGQPKWHLEEQEPSELPIEAEEAPHYASSILDEDYGQLV